jgi:chromosome segregation ATPase
MKKPLQRLAGAEIWKLQKELASLRIELDKRDTHLSLINMENNKLRDERDSFGRKADAANSRIRKMELAGAEVDKAFAIELKNRLDEKNEELVRRWDKIMQLLSQLDLAEAALTAAREGLEGMDMVEKEITVEYVHRKRACDWGKCNAGYLAAAKGLKSINDYFSAKEKK